MLSLLGRSGDISLQLILFHNILVHVLENNLEVRFTASKLLGQWAFFHGGWLRLLPTRVVVAKGFDSILLDA